MTNKTRWFPLPAQLVATAVIVFVLVGAAQMASSDADATLFDEAAEQTRLQFEGAGRGVLPIDHELAGEWTLEYEDSDISLTLVYDLREEQGQLNGYLVEMVDESGHSAQANTLIFELVSWNTDELTGEGVYHVEYEGDRYAVECVVELQDSGELRVRYNYYGYNGDEIWKRVHK